MMMNHLLLQIGGLFATHPIDSDFRFWLSCVFSGVTSGRKCKTIGQVVKVVS